MRFEKHKSVNLCRPVSSETSDFRPCTHAQSKLLHTKYADETDYWGLGIRV